ncbi:condensation domain-containing protein [Actinomadura roseirufa]|uniref:condensation domain-containing protein n=1 Tax=Actinomadura roseirufa TaxID=2094049 RepID=UPI0013F1609D|nr:condensation domain-containing protein [Actinomadura roseirufa]
MPTVPIPAEVPTVPAAPAPAARPPGGEPALRLTPGQERRWAAARADGWRSGFMSPIYRVPAGTDPGLLARALSGAVHRHAPLRTRITPGPDGAPLATLRTVPDPYPLEVVDLTGLPAGERADRRALIAARELAAPVDLATDWPLRAVLVALGPEGHDLYLTLSHVVADGWSLGVLVTELRDRYRMLSRGVTPPRDQWDAVWAAHVDDCHENPDPGGGLGWWRARLGGASCRLELGPPSPDTTGLTIPFTLPASVSDDLRRTAAALGTGTTCVALAAAAAFLARLTGVPELLVTVPYAGRHKPAHEPLVGLFNNRLLLRVPAGPAATLEDLADRAHEALLDALEHAETPFQLIEDEVFPGDAASTTQTAVQIIPRSLCDAPATEPGDVSFRLTGFPTARTRFQFCLDIVEPDEGPFSGWMTCQAGVLPPETARGLLAGYIASLRELTRAPDRPAGPLLAETEPVVAAAGLTDLNRARREENPWNASRSA